MTKGFNSVNSLITGVIGSPSTASVMVAFKASRNPAGVLGGAGVAGVKVAGVGVMGVGVEGAGVMGVEVAGAKVVGSGVKGAVGCGEWGALVIGRKVAGVGVALFGSAGEWCFDAAMPPPTPAPIMTKASAVIVAILLGFVCAYSLVVSQ